MTLDNLPIGKPAIILTVGGEGDLRCHLLDMGLIPHTEVTVRKVAPLGDPVEITVRGDPLELYLRGYTMTLRKEDAARIEVRPKEEI